MITTANIFCLNVHTIWRSNHIKKRLSKSHQGFRSNELYNLLLDWTHRSLNILKWICLLKKHISKKICHHYNWKQIISNWLRTYHHITKYVNWIFPRKFRTDQCQKILYDTLSSWISNLSLIFICISLKCRKNESKWDTMISIRDQVPKVR